MIQPTCLDFEDLWNDQLLAETSGINACVAVKGLPGYWCLHHGDRGIASWPRRGLKELVEIAVALSRDSRMDESA